MNKLSLEKDVRIWITGIYLLAKLLASPDYSYLETYKSFVKVTIYHRENKRDMMALTCKIQE